MQVILDTNHFRELVEEGPLGLRLLSRIDERNAGVFTCIVVAEESIRGWFAVLNRERPGHAQLYAYHELQRAVEALGKFDILSFDQRAADVFADLRRRLPRAGTMDLKIASICIANSALLLSRNLSDFEHVPGLQVENWLD